MVVGLCPGLGMPLLGAYLLESLAAPGKFKRRKLDVRVFFSYCKRVDFYKGNFL